MVSRTREVLNKVRVLNARNLVVDIVKGLEAVYLISMTSRRQKDDVRAHLKNGEGTVTAWKQELSRRYGLVSYKLKMMARSRALIYSIPC